MHKAVLTAKPILRWWLATTLAGRRIDATLAPGAIRGIRAASSCGFGRHRGVHESTRRPEHRTAQYGIQGSNYIVLDGCNFRHDHSPCLRGVFGSLGACSSNFFELAVELTQRIVIAIRRLRQLKSRDRIREGGTDMETSRVS